MPDELAELAKNTAERAELLTERDALIRAARAAGKQVNAIADASGLTRQQVTRILNEPRETRLG